MFTGARTYLNREWKALAGHSRAWALVKLHMYNMSRRDNYVEVNKRKYEIPNVSIYNRGDPMTSCLALRHLPSGKQWWSGKEQSHHMQGGVNRWE